MRGQFSIPPSAKAIRLSRALLASTLCMGTLTACSGSDVKDTLGLNRRAPDEFRVLARPPLSVPPEFSLRPPGEGSEITGTQTGARSDAQALVFGENNGATNTNLRAGSAETAVVGVTVNDAATPSDARFLTRAGANAADPSIRERLRAETPSTEAEDKTLLDTLREPTRGEPLVDAGKEAERLKENKEAGKPVTEGETPTVKPRDRGVIGKIF